jgi:hypothetical protein
MVVGDVLQGVGDAVDQIVLGDGFHGFRRSEFQGAGSMTF